MLLSILLLFIIWPFIAAYIWKTTISYKEVVIQVLVVSTSISILWFTGQYTNTKDTEIHNGYILSKKVTTDSYTRSYQCNCTSYSCGTTSSPRTCQRCSTCYEKRYTKDWTANSTLGKITFKSLDSTSRSTWATPNPSSYNNCQPGDFAAKTFSYTNYLKDTSDSLFNANKALTLQYKDKIPAQPKVFNFYKYNRVIDQQNLLTSDQYNHIKTNLDTYLKKAGKTKQVNIIVVVTSHPKNFKYAVENAWEGGEKNDVTVFLGIKDQKIVWTDVMTWAFNSKNELLTVKLRDALTTSSLQDVPNVIIKNVNSYWVRPKMKDYEYLKDSAEPSTTLILIAFIFGILLSGFLTRYFHKNEI